MLRDRFSNPVKAGQMLFWIPTGLRVKVLAVDNASDPKSFTISVQLALPPGLTHPMATDFICPAEPETEEASSGAEYGTSERVQ
jgi:hypothetical protein